MKEADLQRLLAYCVFGVLYVDVFVFVGVA